jgi:prevent-host-death family protein
MDRVGIRELKAKLSSYVERVRKGESITITEHGEEVGIIIPISADRKKILSLVKSGAVNWSGDKPRGIKGIIIKRKPLSETILEEIL